MLYLLHNYILYAVKQCVRPKKAVARLSIIRVSSKVKTFATIFCMLFFFSKQYLVYVNLTLNYIIFVETPKNAHGTLRVGVPFIDNFDFRAP